MASKKSKSYPKDPDIGDCKDGPVVHNYITNYVTLKVQDSRNVQIGDHNSMTPEEDAQRILQHPKESGLSKNEVVIGFINNILNPTLSEKQGEMRVSELEMRFNQLTKRLSGKKLTFNDVAKCKILQFLEKHPHWYEISSKKQNYFVKIKVRKIKEMRNPTKRKSVNREYVTDECSSTEEVSETDYFTAGDTCYSDMEGRDKVGKVEEDDSQPPVRTFSRSLSMDSPPDESDDDAVFLASSGSTESWTKVTRKRSKPKRRRTFSSPKDFDVKEKVLTSSADQRLDKLGVVVVANHEDGNLSRIVSKSDTDSLANKGSRNTRRKTPELDKLKLSQPDHNNSDQSHLEELLIAWTENPSSLDVMEKDLAFYMENPAEFIKDIISAWNTPNRSEIYILFQFDKEVNDDDTIEKQRKIIEELLKTVSSDTVTNYPNISSFEVGQHRGKIAGYIEIPSSRGCGQPAVTKNSSFNFQGNDYQLGDNELWYRLNNKRMKSSFNDQMLSTIYRWFDESDIPEAGTTSKSTRHVCTSTTTPPGSKNKMDWNAATSHFMEYLNSFNKGHFVLVCGDIDDVIKHRDAISFVPWLYVYDFDIYSRDKGLLNINERLIENKRSLHLCTWKDSATGISEAATFWMFPRGRRDDTGSRLQNEDDVRHWSKMVKSRLKTYIDQLNRFVESYTVLTMVVIWPKNEALLKFMHKFIEIVDESIEPRIVLVLPNEPKTDIGRSTLEILRDDQRENLKTFKLDMTNLFQVIKDRLKNRFDVTNTIFSLPEQQFPVSPREAAWLREDMEVLYLENQHYKISYDVTDLAKERDQFYKGGTIHWFAWYESGDHLWDVERDEKRHLHSNIKTAIEKNKCEIITLYHAPGSGGTTLAQRVIWELHETIACAHVKLRSSSSVADLASRVELLSEKTHKPILLLIDGEEEARVNHLMRNLRSRCQAIILYVKRFPYEFKERGSKTKVWLKSTVSKFEAKNLALKFGDRCSSETKVIKQLNNLSREVQENHPHFLYEFGMTAFTHDFKGVHSYVKGYLRLHENENRTCKGLQPWQKILGYLSLVYFYGQASIPCQFFATLLGLQSNEIVGIGDFRHPIADFIVQDKNEARKGYIRICHHIIAQEILQQILGGSKGVEERGPELGQAAKSNLAEFCKDFIDYASDWKSKSSGCCSTIVHVLTRTFIFRDNKDMCENAEQIRKKPVLSRIIIDIPSKHPLYTDRLQILERLTEAFPDDPNFQAHLGRFYAYCRPGDENKAEQCLEKALDLALTQTENKCPSELEERWKLTLMHIYHMYGTILQKKIALYTGQSYNDIPDRDTKKSEFKHRLETLVPLAEMSCEHFQKCRECTPVGRENCFGYVGEITVRLQLCDFIQRNFEVSREELGLYGFLNSTDDPPLPGKQFVKSSISIVDNLFMECYNVIEEEEIDQAIVKAVLWYNHLFKKNSLSLKQIPKSEDICGYRLQIAIKKMKYSTKCRDYTLLENINNPKDIQDIVSWYEEIFRNIPFDGPRENKRILDRDYQEWLFAIRHKSFQPLYKTEDVLQIVRTWNNHLRTPMAKFYLFIITSLIGFGSREESGKTDMLLEAQTIYKEEMRKVGKFLLKPKYPREWLGKDTNGIRRLLPGTRFLGLNMEDRDTKGMNQADLAICKGTIVHPNNKKGAGFIWLDLGDVNVPVRVFFIPNVANLASTHYSDKRVEFVLAFTVENGYEAYSVKLLAKYGCPNECSGTVEIVSTEDYGFCPICNCRVQKDEMARVD